MHVHPRLIQAAARQTGSDRFRRFCTVVSTHVIVIIIISYDLKVLYKYVCICIAP